jgi:RHS repeat-associated protein
MRDDTPVSNVFVSAPGLPQFGQTRTRADGRFDMVVNGGAPFTLRFERDGFLTVDRIVNPEWNDTVTLRDVVLTQVDPIATAVALGAGETQVAVGSVSDDADGERQGMLVVPPATQATIVLPNGDTVPLDIATLRITEYTVGEQGAAAMPASLPPTTGYTYAVELSADEATELGASRVEFDQPLAFYVDNFLGFPVGEPVPAGFYDGDLRAWTPSANGVVLEVLSAAGGVAEIDSDGDGLADGPAQLAALGVDDDELLELAARYVPGHTLWRVPITHFSPWDCNWPFGPPPNAKNEGNSPPPPPPPCGGGSEAQGSIIRCERQALGEEAQVAGTPFTLNYSSERVPAYAPNRRILLNLIGPDVHPQLKFIDVQIDVAGQSSTQRFLPQPNLSTTFQWDGLDGFGRLVVGTTMARVAITAVYPGIYYTSEESRFGSPSPEPGQQIVGSMARSEIGIVNNIRVPLEGRLPLEGWSLGDWTLSEHHFYDSLRRKLHFGNGESVLIGGIGAVEIVAGNGGPSFAPDGTPAKTGGMDLKSFEVGPDGDVYTNDSRRIRRISAKDGLVTTLVGATQLFPCPGASSFGDGGPAIDARVGFPEDLAITADGSIYFTDSFAHRIRRVRPDGTIETVAGAFACDTPANQGGFSGDGGPAQLARLRNPDRMALGPDGSIFFVDRGNRRIRKIDPSGTITTVAGNAFGGAFVQLDDENQVATSVSMERVEDIAVGPDGTLYILMGLQSAIVSVRPDGILRMVSGGDSNQTPFEDGAPIGTQSVGSFATALAIDQRGTLFFNDHGSSHPPNPARPASPMIRSVSSTGTADTVAWGGESAPTDGSIALGSGIPFTSVTLSAAPDGSMLYGTPRQIFMVRRTLAKGCDVTASALVPYEEKDEAYCFDEAGRHLGTLDLRTGAVVYSFQYLDGRLESITDANGNVTAIERSGSSIDVVAPYGQRTTLELGPAGRATLIDDGEAPLVLEPRSDGLLMALVDKGGFRHEFGYDASGLLTSDEDPAGGIQTLNFTALVNGQRVERTSALGHVTRYDLERDMDGVTTWTVQAPDGTSTVKKVLPNGSQELTSADGTHTTVSLQSDPRFSMQEPFVGSKTMTTPNGLSQVTVESRSAAFSVPGEPFSLTNETVTRAMNGKTWSSVYTASDRTFVTTSPAGRTTSRILDEQGRLVRLEIGGLAPIDFIFDPQGRLDRVTQGARTTQHTYIPSGPSAGYLASTTDATGSVLTFTRDVLGRVLTETRASATTSFSWDPLGSVASVTPPGRPPHQMTHTSVNLLETYAPPAAGLPSSATGYAYDFDRMLRTETQPNGVTIVSTPDSAGRLDTVAIPGGLLDYDYAASSAPSGAGQVSNIHGPYGVNLSFGYDGSLTTSASWSGDVVGNVATQFNDDFLQILETASGTTGAASTAFGYDDDQLLTCASPTSCSPPGTDALILTRHPQHGLASGLLLDQTNETWTYNVYGEPARQTATFGGSPFVDITYDESGFERDGLGRLVRKVETILGVTKVYEYRYDALHHLDQVKIDGVVDEEFTYDGNGNRLTAFKAGVGTVSATYDDQDRLLSYGTWTLTYTANGELETKTNTATNETWIFRYDALGNLVSAGLPNGELVEYLVDGMGRRVGKKKNGVLVQQWIYTDGLRPAAELDASGALVTRFAYLSKPNVPDYVVRAGATYRVVSDQLGSPRYAVRSNDSANAPLKVDYSAFGEASGIGLDWLGMGFSGGVYDSDTRLLRFGARDYDPTFGRWMAKDPLRFGGGEHNLYLYALGDPVNYYDLTGKEPITAAAAAAAAAGAVGTYIAGKYSYCLFRKFRCENVLNERDKAKRPPPLPRDFDECGPPPVVIDDEDVTLPDEEANEAYCHACYDECMYATGFFGWPLWPARCP